MSSHGKFKQKNRKPSTISLRRNWRRDSLVPLNARLPPISVSQAPTPPLAMLERSSGKEHSLRKAARRERFASRMPFNGSVAPRLWKSPFSARFQPVSAATASRRLASAFLSPLSPSALSQRGIPFKRRQNCFLETLFAVDKNPMEKYQNGFRGGDG